MRAFVAVVLLAWSLGVAGAQPPDAQTPAEAMFAKGRELLDRHDYTGACEQFEHAIALDPTAPGIMLNLGLCYELLDKYATSLFWFRKAQVAAAETGKLDYEDAAKEHTRVLATTKVVTARIDVSAAPADVEITIDGRPVRPSEYPLVEVDVGSELVARARGKQSVTIIAANGRDAGTIRVVIAGLEPPMIDPGKTRRRLAYVVGGAGVVMWGVTVAYGLSVRAEYNQLRTPETQAEAKDKLRYNATGMFLGGAAGAAIAVYLYVTAAKPYPEHMHPSAFAPLVGPDQLGVTFGGDF